MEAKKGKVKKMDGSDYRVSSSSSPNRSSSHSLPKGMGENSHMKEEMRPNVKGQKKHSMSPTVAVASKATPLRKKILAERNDLETTPFQRTQNLDSRTSSGSDLGENKKSSLADGLSALSPYDPLTNYLSPRPEFLRYKPKRKQEIILRRENEIKEGNCNLSVSGEEDSSSSCGSLITDYPVGNLNQQDREVSDCDEEIEEWVEEEEEKGCCCFRGVLKFLLLLVVLVLSTSYISSMNSPNPSPVVQAVEGLKNGYHIIHDNVYGFVKSLEGRNHSLVETQGTEMSLARLDRIGVEMIEDVKMEGVENSDWSIEGEGIQSEDHEFSKCAESEAMDLLEYEDSGTTSKLGDILEVQGEESKLVGEGTKSEDGEYSACAKCEDMDMVEYEDSGATDWLGDMVEVQSEESKLVSNPEEVEREEVFDNVEVNSDVEGTVGVEITESPFMVDGVNHQGIPFNLENMTYDRENEAGSESQEEEVIGNQIVATDAADDCEEHEALIDEADGSFDMMHFLYQGMFISCVAGLIASALVYLMLSLSDFIYSRRKRTARKHSISGNAESCSELVAEQKYDSAHVDKEDKHIKHPVSIENPRSLVNSMEENPEDDYQSRVPSIELLGEFVVEGMSNSRRSHGMKSGMDYSVSREESMDNKAHSVEDHVQPALSEISIMNSPSYGRFTDEETAVKKQKGRAEDRKVVTTPVRRSSRIRNRAASP